MLVNVALTTTRFQATKLELRLFSVEKAIRAQLSNYFAGGSASLNTKLFLCFSIATLNLLLQFL